jgi:carboxylesterase
MESRDRSGHAPLLTRLDEQIHMIGFWLLAPLALVAAGALNRHRLKRTVEQEYVNRFARNAEGIVEGAEGFQLAGTNGRGVLLLHGFGDSPQSLRYLGALLHAAGYTVHAPLLPGHGRSPAAFAAANADEYHAAACRSLTELCAVTDWLGIVGLSMGGALATTLAQEAPNVRVLALLAPYLIPAQSVRWARQTAALWNPISPYLPAGGGDSVRDSAARDASRAYGSVSVGALDALVATADAGWRALSHVRVPTLIVNSDQDNRIPRTLATRVLHEIRAPTETHWVTGCGHVITVDYCRDAVAGLVLAFLARHAD